MLKRASFRVAQHAGENLQSQVLFVVQSVCSTLDDADLVVQSFHASEGDLVLWPTIGGDSVPMPIDHLGKFLIGFEALPLQTRPPVSKYRRAQPSRS